MKRKEVGEKTNKNKKERKRIEELISNKEVKASEIVTSD